MKSSRSIYRSSLERLAAAAEESIAHRPFKYVTKGSMATVSRFSAVAQVGKFEFGGFIAWLAWLVLHLLYLVGFKNRFTTVIAWFITFITHSRGQLAITSQMIYARLAMDMLQSQHKEALAAAEEAEQLERSTQPAASTADGSGARKQQAMG